LEIISALSNLFTISGTYGDEVKENYMKKGMAYFAQKIIRDRSRGNEACG
jgi:hypothetical protein